MDSSSCPLNWQALQAIEQFLKENGINNCSIKMHRRVDPEDDGPDHFYVGIDTDIEDAMSVDVLGDTVYLWDRRVASQLHVDRSFTMGYLADPKVFDTLLTTINQRW